MWFEVEEIKTFYGKDINKNILPKKYKNKNSNKMLKKMTVKGIIPDVIQQIKKYFDKTAIQ